MTDCFCGKDRHATNSTCQNNLCMTIARQPPFTFELYKKLTMMKFLTSLFLISSVAAFAPVQQSKISSTSLSAWKDEVVIGITAPVGFFDPLGLSVGKSDATMNYYREAELKNGRVAMAACLGWYITAGGTHPAFDGSLSDDPLKAAVELPVVGWLQFILGCGDILGAAYWVDNSDAGWVDYQNKEITNGRLAMLAFLGIFTQDTLFGNYGDMIFNKQ
jgi:light-harvesting complex I chlorophyll a/b binding protein 4